MATSFENKFNALKALCNKIVVPLSIVMIIAALFGFGGGVSFFIGSILLIFALIPNLFWFIPTGWVGFKARFNKVRPKSYGDGIHIKIPIIDDIYLTDLRVQTKSETDTKKVLTRNNVTLEYTLTYQVDQKYAHLLFRYLGENYFTTHLHPWVDAVFDTFVSRLTYPQLQTQKEQIEKIASALIRQEVDMKCGEFSKSDGEHDGYRCEFSSDDTLTIDLDEDGSTESIPKLELVEWTEDNTDGVNFFKSFDLKINKVTFENGYEEARAKVAVAKAEVAEAEQKKRQAIIFAEGQKEVARIKAEGEAAAQKLIGEMEAHIIEQKGKGEGQAILAKGISQNTIAQAFGAILRDHPELNLNEAVKHLPHYLSLALGGNTNTNLDIAQFMAVIEERFGMKPKAETSPETPVEGEEVIEPEAKPEPEPTTGSEPTTPVVVP